MKMSRMFLALLLSTLVLSGCASTTKKSCARASQNPPAASSSVVADQPAAAPVSEPVANEIPAATRKYVNK
ncbi:MAG: hypothetical protein WC530_04690 [Candidatus Omnitrophota bacterium]|jgi:PBP1b-binding outer membrane lipoprotein LpoB